MNARLTTTVRLFAIAIAIAGAVDPAVTSERADRPRIALIEADSATRTPETDALTDRVADALRGRFTVVRAPIAGAAATVVVGTGLPAGAAEFGSPLYAVIPARTGPTVTLEAVSAPERSLVSSRVPVMVRLHVTGSAGRHIEVALGVAGLIIDRTTRDVAGDDTVMTVPLTYVPTAAGTTTLHVEATVPGGSRMASADVMSDVRDTRWPILFFDPRPSWMSTFVRRAVERDPRFVVTSRVVTSRGISTDAGQPPETLNDLASLGLFDVVVVGAPEALTDAQVAGLDDFLRHRGGSVVLLLDHQADGPYRRLTAVDRWATSSDDSALFIAPAAPDSGALRAGEIAWPTRLPGGASAVALSRGTATGRRTAAADPAHPVVWRSAAGSGTVVVSGALDAWRFRDDSVSAFDAFWRAVLATSANGAVPAIEIQLDRPVLAPDEVTALTVVLRDPSLADPAAGTVRADVSASLDDETSGSAATATTATPATGATRATGSAEATRVRLWPDGPVGTFHGTIRAPREVGVHHLVISSGGTRAEASFVVAGSVARPMPDDQDLLTMWSAAHGGVAVRSDHLEELTTALSRTVAPVPHRMTWYPMRSAWWMFPFVLALGFEWWARRRRGQP